MVFDEETLKLFNDSLERCQSNPQFLNLFYQNFVISNSEVREKFSNTNMENQKMMLHASLYMIMIASQGNEAATAYLERVAKKHSKIDLDIRPELYGLWLETLINTISETDEMFDEKTEKAWRAILTYGIDYMKSKYDD